MTEISIIIPTFNRSGILRKNLALVERETKRIKTEIIIIDDGSNRDEFLMVEDLQNKYDNVLVLKQNHQGPAAARNLGMRRAKGKILVFINDDTLVGKDFLKKHLDFHQKNDSDETALIGPFVEHPELVNTKLMKWLVNDSKLHFKYEKSKDGSLPWYYFWTCNISVKRNFMKKNKLFYDETFPVAAWEDVEFGWRVKNRGLKIYFDKKLKAYHYHYFDLKNLLGRFYSHGQGMYHLIGKMPENNLPMLAKKPYRVLARVILDVSLYPMASWFLRNIWNVEKRPVNWMLQYLIVGEKIKGWDREAGKK